MTKFDIQLDQDQCHVNNMQDDGKRPKHDQLNSIIFSWIFYETTFNTQFVSFTFIIKGVSSRIECNRIHISLFNLLWHRAHMAKKYNNMA